MTIQPTLPLENSYSDVEKEFIELSPRGLYPENQDSNYGQFRKITTDIIQECVDFLTILDVEMYPSTSSRYLSLWEEMFGLPVASAGKTDAQRRALIQPFLRQGVFSRGRRNGVIESFILPLIGAGSDITLLPPGVDLPAGGTTMGSGLTSLIGTYRVYEDIRNFTWDLWIKSSVTPDIAGLTKELKRISPYTFTIDNTKADVLDYFRLVRNAQPTGYWRLSSADNTDVSGYGSTLSQFGTMTVIASPGLLHANTAGGSGGRDLDGSTGYLGVAVNTAIGTSKDTGQISQEIWVRPDALPGAGVHPVANYIPGGGLIQVQDSVGGRRFEWFVGGGPQCVGLLSGAIVVGTTYHVVGTYDGRYGKLYINGVLQDTQDWGVRALAPFGNSVYIGWDGSSVAPNGWWNGGVDEPAVYNYALSAATILDHYNTGRDVATY